MNSEGPEQIPINFDRSWYLLEHLDPDDVYVGIGNGGYGDLGVFSKQEVVKLPNVLLFGNVGRTYSERQGIRPGTKISIGNLEKQAQRLQPLDKTHSELTKIVGRIRRADENRELIATFYNGNPLFYLLWDYVPDFFHYFGIFLSTFGWTDPITQLHTEKKSISDEYLREKWPKAHADRNIILKTGLVVLDNDEYSVPKILYPNKAIEISEKILLRTKTLVNYESQKEIDLLMAELEDLSVRLSELPDLI